MFQYANGGEYTSREFLDYLAASGTELRLSCPQTSQQNGHSERMMRTINNLVYTLLIQARMLYSFGAEALHTVVHTLNLLPSSFIYISTPFSRLFNKPATYSHLRVFGCLYYPNLLPTSSHKPAPRSSTCVFLAIRQTIASIVAWIFLLGKSEYLDMSHLLKIHFHFSHYPAHRFHRQFRVYSFLYHHLRHFHLHLMLVFLRHQPLHQNLNHHLFLTGWPLGHKTGSLNLVFLFVIDRYNFCSSFDSCLGS